MKIMERPVVRAADRPRVGELARREPGYQAFGLLYAGYVALPVIAGLDKFFHYLVNWDQYLAPVAASLIGGRVSLFMNAVGVVEIAAGVLTAVNPRIGGLVVAAWLGGIIVNLLLIPGFFDVALRAFGLAIGALALSRLALQYERRA